MGEKLCLRRAVGVCAEVDIGPWRDVIIGVTRMEDCFGGTADEQKVAKDAKIWKYLEKTFDERESVLDV